MKGRRHKETRATLVGIAQSLLAGFWYWIRCNWI